MGESARTCRIASMASRLTSFRRPSMELNQNRVPFHPTEPLTLAIVAVRPEPDYNIVPDSAGFEPEIPAEILLAWFRAARIALRPQLRDQPTRGIVAVTTRIDDIVLLHGCIEGIAPERKPRVESGCAHGV